MNWDELPAVLLVPEVARALRLGKNSVYEAIRRGDIPHWRCGRSIRVSKAALMAYLGMNLPTPGGSPGAVSVADAR